MKDTVFERGVNVSLEIGLKPEDAWGFYEGNLANLAEEMVQIAWDKENDFEVYLTLEELLTVIVQRGSETLVSEPIVSREDCEETIGRVYQFIEDFVDDDEDERSLQESEIMYRDEEIESAFYDFLHTLVDEDGILGLEELFSDDHGIVEDKLDEIITWLTDMGMDIRRPMFVINELTGEEEFSEYPYSEYDLKG